MQRGSRGRTSRRASTASKAQTSIQKPSDLAVIATGSVCPLLEFRPHCPSVFLPQQRTSSVPVKTAHVWYPPASTLNAGGGVPETTPGERISPPHVPLPSCALSFAPQH